MVIIYSGWNDISNMFRFSDAAYSYERIFAGSDLLLEKITEDTYLAESKWAIMRQIGRWKHKSDKKKKKSYSQTQKSKKEGY